MSPRHARACKAALAAAALYISGVQGALAQALGQGGDVDISLWRVAGALILCSLLAVGGALALRARGGALPSLSFSLPFTAARRRRLKTIETLRLSQNAVLSIVECDGRELLILVSQDGGRVLEELPAARRAEVTERA